MRKFHPTYDVNSTIKSKKFAARFRQGVKTAVPKSKNQRLLEQLPLNDPLRKAIRVRPRTPKTLEQMMELQNYQKTNWVRLRAVANAMDIQEPIELLLEQLKS